MLSRKLWSVKLAVLSAERVLVGIGRLEMGEMRPF